MRVEDLEAIRVKLASPEEILSWSHGEVTKPETINYRTQRAEKDGLFCEKIFGPEKDYQCYCGKYKGIRYKGLVCDRCGVEITRSEVRRERMGHIKLAIPCSHIWFLKGIPSRMSMVLDVPQNQLEGVIYYASYIVTKVDKTEKKRILEEIENEYREKIKSQGSEKTKTEDGLELEDLNKLKNKAREEILSIKPLKIISEIEYRNLVSKYGQFFEAETGAEPLRKIFEKINLKREIEKIKRKIERGITGEKNKELKRLRFLRDLDKAGIRPEWMFLTVIPVLPPDLRPTVQLDGGRYASSDLNDLYRRVINRNNRLKYLLEIKAPDVIIRNEKRMLQEAVDALVDNSMRKGELTTRASSGGRRVLKSLADALKGKRGRFRQNLLGKRVDYSGRSVIVVGPELKLNQCGIPKKMALELFKPFVIGKLLEKELAYNVQGAVRLIEEETDEVWAALEEVVKNRAVLLNRAPTLHRLGIQAFYPLLIEGEAIQLHPMVCKAFNADFDGDQMAVHLPLSKNAQKEAKEIMLPSYNLLKPASGTPIATLYQDIVLGCYSLTKIEDEHSKDAAKKEVKGEGKIFADPEEALLALELNRIKTQEKIKVRIKGKIIETSAGRIIFNRALPNDFPFQNRLINIDALNEIASQVIEKYSSEETQKILDNIKSLGFKYSTLSGITWGMDDLVVPSQKPEIIERAKNEVITIENYYKKGLLSKEERRTKIIEVWTKAKSEIEKLVPAALPKNGPVFTMVDSGSRGGWTQPVQMSGMKGLVINPAGEIIELPVISSYKEGLTVLEYFISTHGARKGTADTALRTSSAGYLTRRLVDVAHGVFTRESDCGDKKGIEVYLSDAKEASQDYIYKIVGRYCLEEIKHPKTKKIIVKAGEIIDWKKAKKIKEAGIEKVRVRSPLSCKGKEGICQKCYGWDMAKNKLIQEGQAIGIVAAQAIGEPGTQLTLRTFHTGGVAGSGDITSGLPRVQELFEARVPGGKAEISPVDGKVLEITKNRVVKIKTNIGQKEKIIEYKISPNLAISVKPGDKIKKGQPLCEGNLDLRELFRTSGKEAVQRYIIKEIQKVYAGQGAIIHDKHIEVIVSQMFSRLKITDPGDSEFLPGEVVSKIKFSEVNKEIKRENKKPAKGKQILLGITPVALTTDSFLSAASFQQTHRVLIKACLKGQEDRLRGLKENVIIGKLIPVGTGFKK